MNHSSSAIDWLAHAAARTPDATALIDDDGTATSYQQLSDLADEAAGEFTAAGVMPGEIEIVPIGCVDRDLIARLWGAWRSGIAPLVIEQDSFRLEERTRSLRDLIAAGTPTAAGSPLHSVVLTSGSSGLPRPVRLTAGNVAASVTGSQRRLGNTSEDRWLLTLPLFHIGGLSVLWRSAAAGSSVVVHRKFDAARAAAAIRAGEVTMVSFVPTMLYRMLEVDPGPYRGLRCLLLGGSAASRQLVERGIEAGLPVAQTYGMTEACSQIATVAPGEGFEALGTTGRPVDGVHVTTGEAGVGEIVVSGPTISPGYLGEPDRVGGHGTGDIGYVDENGRLVVLGRADDMVVTGGENVYPRAVAEVLIRNESVRQVEIVGVPDPEWGQALVAIVVGDEDKQTQIVSWAQAHLPRHEIPKHWAFVGGIPQQSGGKVDRVALYDMARSAR